MKKGKVYSKVNMGQRKPSDFYETPYSMTEQGLQVIKLKKNYSILEPASGKGAISRVLEIQGYKNVTSQDIQTGEDFLKQEKQYSYIITNPPFSLSLPFILKSKQIAKVKFALLMPLVYLHGIERLTQVYRQNDYPFQGVYVFARMPMLGDPLRYDGKYRTGMQVYAWFVWNREYSGEPGIHWIDNNKYIVSVKNKDEMCGNCEHCQDMEEKKKGYFVVTCGRKQINKIRESICPEWLINFDEFNKECKHGNSVKCYNNTVASNNYFKKCSRENCKLWGKTRVK